MTLDPRNYENTERDWERLVVDIDAAVLHLCKSGEDDDSILASLVAIRDQPWHSHWREQLTYLYGVDSPRIQWLRQQSHL